LSVQENEAAGGTITGAAIVIARQTISGWLSAAIGAETFVAGVLAASTRLNVDEHREASWRFATALRPKR
jgi:hypothetical protein